MRSCCLFAAALALCITVPACGDDPVTPVPPFQVTVIQEHPFPPRGVHDIWGAAANDIHAVGSGGELLHYDGAWKLVDSPTDEQLVAVWGLSADNVVAAGYSGTILRFDGDDWAVETSGTGQRIDDVWGAAEDSIFAVGYNGMVLRFDGQAWGLFTDLPTTYRHQIWGTSGDNFYVAAESLYHFDGTRWSNVSVPLSFAVYAISGSSASDVWFSQATDDLWHFDGVDWQEVDTGLGAPFHGLWSVGRNKFFGCGHDGLVARYDDGTLSAESLGNFNLDLTGVWASGDANAWVTGSTGMGAGTLHHFEGETWMQVGQSLTNSPLQAIWSNESGEHAVAVGKEGTLLEKEDGVWRALDVTTLDLEAVWGAPTGEIFVASSWNTVLEFDGTEWHETVLDTTFGFTSIWGTSRSNVYLGTFHGLWHYDGTEWAPTGVDDWIESIWGSSASNVVVGGVSEAGAIIKRYNGQSWTPIYFNAYSSIKQVTGNHAGDLFAAVQEFTGHAVDRIERLTDGKWRDITPAGYDNVTVICSNDQLGLVASVYNAETLGVFVYRGFGWEPLPELDRHLFSGAWGEMTNAMYLVAGGTIIRLQD